MSKNFSISHEMLLLMEQKIHLLIAEAIIKELTGDHDLSAEQIEFWAVNGANHTETVKHINACLESESAKIQSDLKAENAYLN